MRKDVPKDVQRDRTLRCRYEMKYVISESKAAAIARFIEPYLSLDHYSRLQPNGFYPIISLYLDSDNLRLCMESLRGQLKRFKLRIRSYTDDPDYPRFFEIKRRTNTVIIKSRARVRAQDVATLLSGQYISPLQKYKTDVDAIKQFQLYMKSIDAGPKVLIRYMRRAYEGNMENRVRVTFDRKLAYNVSNTPNVSFSSRGWQPNSVTVRSVILEVKFTERYPVWLSQMTEYFDLRQRSMSKYANSIVRSFELGFCAPKTPIQIY
jgi:SPX domain protein involved in polyphosphate accumulation